jgi:hypothetical protein
VASVSIKYKDKVASPKLPSGDFLVGAFGEEIGILRNGGAYGWYWMDHPSETFSSRPEAIDEGVQSLIAQGLIIDNPDFSIRKRQAISTSVKAFVGDRDSGRCQYCNTEVSGANECFDHFIPVAFGGASTSDNVVLSCKRCNRTKWHIPPWRIYGEQWKDRAPGKPRPEV